MTRPAGLLAGGDPEKAEQKFVKAVGKGIVKVCSKMGISTIQSYHGAQVFEAIGLNSDFIAEYFTWTASRIAGIGLDEVAAEVRLRHQRAFPDRPLPTHTLDPGGQYQYRRDGEYHLFNPESIHKLQYACRTGNYSVYKEYAKLVDDQAKHLCTLRGLMELDSHRPPVPIEEVESVDAIVKRFKTGAMSYGSISSEAHETLAIAMNRIGGKSNTGEGGEDPARYVPRRERRLAQQRDQAGRVGALRRHQRLPGQRRGAADQDGAGREARRGRPAARVQGLSLDRQGAERDAGRGPDLAAAPPRHLLDRGSGAADPRPEERQHATRASA